MIVISDSVMPTVATASAPRRPTKKTSATANTDSISISSTIGMASSITARPMEISVKLAVDPRTASRMVCQSEGESDTMAREFIRLFVAEGFDRIEARGFERGIHAEEDPDGGREPEADRVRPPGQRHGEARDEVDGEADAAAERAAQ